MGATTPDGAARAERDELRATVERVEALAALFRKRADSQGSFITPAARYAYLCVSDSLRAALDPS